MFTIDFVFSEEGQHTFGYWLLHNVFTSPEKVAWWLDEAMENNIDSLDDILDLICIASLIWHEKFVGCDSLVDTRRLRIMPNV